jgi:hypothetical protein
MIEPSFQLVAKEPTFRYVRQTDLSQVICEANGELVRIGANLSDIYDESTGHSADFNRDTAKRVQRILEDLREVNNHIVQTIIYDKVGTCDE